jgi:hypothetical protein
VSEFYLESVGVLGPGLPDWQTARRVLGGELPHRAEIQPQPNPLQLPPNERRRVPKLVRWAIAVAHEALSGAQREATEVAMVFSSSSGDGEIVHKLCEAVTSREREVSPTMFHNSVHNAPAGYWSIGTGSRQRSAAVCGHDASFAVGLLEAACLVLAERACVLLVACDLPFPAPLAAVRDIQESFAVALLLSPTPGARAFRRCRLSLAAGPASTRFPQMLPATLATNPAARALPLLAAAARDAEQTVAIAYLGDQHMTVEVSPRR